MELLEIKTLRDAFIFDDPQGAIERVLLGTILGSIEPEVAGECRDAIEQAASDRTFFLMQPVHCAIGRKP